VSQEDDGIEESWEEEMQEEEVVENTDNEDAMKEISDKNSRYENEGETQSSNYILTM